MGRHDDDGDKMTASGEGVGVMCHCHVIKREKFFFSRMNPILDADAVLRCSCPAALVSGRCKS